MGDLHPPFLHHALEQEVDRTEGHTGKLGELPLSRFSMLIDILEDVQLKCLPFFSHIVLCSCFEHVIYEANPRKASLPGIRFLRFVLCWYLRGTQRSSFRVREFQFGCYASPRFIHAGTSEGQVAHVLPCTMQRR